MAKGYLTPDELQLGNVWLKTIFFAAVRDNFNPDYLEYTGYKDEVIAGCKSVYDLIAKKAWDTTDTLYKAAIKNHYLDYVNYRDGAGAAYKLNSKLLCRILANMCQKANVLWDDGSHSPQELEYFKKTEFGAALWEFYCFVSQDPSETKLKINTNSTTRSSSSSSSSTSSSSSSSGGSGAGHTLYRSNCGGLVGNAKETGISQENGRVFWIGGEFVKAGKTQPRIHVSPQDSSSPLTVKFNSGQGYNDCVLYFKSRAQCQAFLDICNQNKPATVQSLQMKQCWEDSNGYCEVHTQYGNAYILAKKLHEGLEEDIEKPEKTEEEYKKAIEEAWNALAAFME